MQTESTRIATPQAGCMMHFVPNKTCDTQNLNMIRNGSVGISQKVSKCVD